MCPTSERRRSFFMYLALPKRLMPIYVSCLAFCLPQDDPVRPKHSRVLGSHRNNLKASFLVSCWGFRKYWCWISCTSVCLYAILAQSMWSLFVYNFFGPLLSSNLNPLRLDLSHSGFHLMPTELIQTTFAQRLIQILLDNNPSKVDCHIT